MVSVECPWCTEPADLGASCFDEFACGACGVVVELAPDQIQEWTDRVA